MDNTVTLAGTLTYEPLSKTTGDENVPMCRFVIGTHRQWKDRRTGENKNFTTHHEVVCYRDLATHVIESCQKGDHVIVVGRLSTRSAFEGGKTDKITEIVADHVALDIAHSAIPIE